MKYTLPYGKTKGITITLPDDIEVIEIHPKDVQPAENPISLLEEALENPIGNVPPLPDLLEDKENIVVVVDDYTRSFPRDNVLIPFFEYLEEIGIEKKRITIIIGSGSHRKPTEDEIKQILGNRIPNEYNIVIHNHKAKDLVSLGTTSRGTPIKVNKTYYDADCKILLTDTTFHYYAGFGGDRKSILPAVSGEETINHNHGMLVDPNSKTGNL
ncbi:MAG: lactate racemase domain-containing protein, partial [Promethearchaeota archaeon]